MKQFMNALSLLGSTLGLGFAAGLNIYATVLVVGFSVRFCKFCRRQKMSLPLLICVWLILWGNFANAQDRGFGLGIIVGEPTGVSLKGWLSKTTAIDAALAWSFAGGDFFQIHGDYLSHNFSLLKVEKGKLPFYYGIGGRIKFFDDERRYRRGLFCFRDFVVCRVLA
jgi:hypothetical protein